MNPHEYEALRRFADAMTACYTPGRGCDSCPAGSKTDCYFDSDDNTREAMDILNRLLDTPFLTAGAFAHLKQRARYALATRSMDLVRETRGAAQMARQLGAIDHEQFKALKKILAEAAASASAEGAEV